MVALRAQFSRPGLVPFVFIGVHSWLNRIVSPAYGGLMPELPEVEILTRHLAPLLKERTVRTVQVRRTRVVQAISTARFKSALIGTRFVGLARRGKYLVFTMRCPDGPREFSLLGH